MIMEPARTKEEEGIQFPYVPEVIVVLILSKLPVKSLFRFRSVSKSWCSLISDPKFTLSTQRPHVIAVSNYYVPNSFIRLIDDQGSVMEIPTPEPLEHKSNVRIRGSCNGLLLVNSEEDLFLWNPSTRSCNRVLSHGRLSSQFRDDDIVSGLCYDSSTDDYKAVMAIINPAHNFHMDVMVGSLRNKTWTQIDFPFNKRIVKSGPVVNQRLHWLVIDSTREDEVHPSSQPNLVVYFDPQTNQFVSLPMPYLDRIREKKIPILGFGAFDGFFSVLLCRDSIIGCDKMEILAMKKYGDDTSWSSLFIISNLLGLDFPNSVPLYSTKKGHVLMLWEMFETILVFSPKKNLHWDCKPAFPSCGHVNASIFVESLASTSSYNWEDDEYMEIFLSGMTMKTKCKRGDGN